jgi:hypothetical protein
MLDSYGRPNVIFSNVLRVGKLTHTVVHPVDERTVWASFIVSYPKAYIAVTKSADFGETWSAPSEVSPQPPNFDKDELAVKGKTVAVAYDDGFNTWVSISLDGGKHWAVHEIFPGSNQFYMSLSAGGAIYSHGNLFFSWNSFDKAHSKKGDGQTYSTRVDVSDASVGVEQCFPALTVGKVAGDVRIGRMDKRTGICSFKRVPMVVITLDV